MANNILTLELKNSGNTVEAIYITESKAAWRLDCEGDKIWVPKSEVYFNKDEQSLVMPEWLYKEKFG